jgi:hypothetical protein
LKRSKETCRRISIATKKAYAEGKLKSPFANNMYKYGRFWSKKNKKQLRYRSSYELHVFKLLDKMPMVESYEYEPFAIPYRRNYDDKASYYPDILIKYIDGSKKLVEIKSLYNLYDEVNDKKFKAARKFCNKVGIVFEVWTEDFIFKHNLREPGVI